MSNNKQFTTDGAAPSALQKKGTEAVAVNGSAPSSLMQKGAAPLPKMQPKQSAPKSPSKKD